MNNTRPCKLVDLETLDLTKFKLEKNNEVTPVPLETIPELEGIRSIEIPNLNKILGVPSKFFFDPLNKNYGRSIFAGKIDLFDDLDQCLSQDSNSVRRSTVIEYFNTDFLERDTRGLQEGNQRGSGSRYGSGYRNRREAVRRLLRDRRSERGHGRFPGKA